MPVKRSGITKLQSSKDTKYDTEFSREFTSIKPKSPEKGVAEVQGKKTDQPSYSIYPGE